MPDEPVPDGMPASVDLSTIEDNDLIEELARRTTERSNSGATSCLLVVQERHMDAEDISMMLRWCGSSANALGLVEYARSRILTDLQERLGD